MTSRRRHNQPKAPAKAGEGIIDYANTDYEILEKEDSNEETRRYKTNPTLENYLLLRRGNPEAEIEVAITGGIEQLVFMEPELRKFGLDPKIIAGVLDADAQAIRATALTLIEKTIEARRRRKAGETHLIKRGKVIPAKLVDWLICCALDAMSWNNRLQMQRDLVVLIRERLGGSSRQYEELSAVNEKRRNAAILAGQLFARGIKPTLRKVARAFGVAPSTVKRWFPSGTFQEQARFYASWFDQDGNLRPLESMLRAKDRAQHPPR